ncbi:MAG: hydroxymethylglutaryl-CoA synthase [Bacteroidota bacterium]
MLDCNEATLSLHKDTPIFDGPYSNDCYRARIREALIDYRQKSGAQPGNMLAQWDRLVFHLPYAFQARRMFSEIYIEELKANGKWAAFIEQHDLSVPCADNYEDREEYLTKCGEFLRMVAKTNTYKSFVQEKIAPGEWASSQVGNLYAGSIFLSLMSTLEEALEVGTDLAGHQIGCFAYGSGSKSKVFVAQVGVEWAQCVVRFGLRQRLANRQAIDYSTYERLHRGQILDNVTEQDNGTFFLADVHSDRDELEGVRHYGYRSEAFV